MQTEEIAFADKSGVGVHEKVLEIAEPYLDGARILVAGAGQGSLEHKLITRGVPPKMIEAVDCAPEQYKLDSVEVHRCDLNGPIPFEPEKFDIVFATEVIEHLTDPHNLIDESWRILAPGGMLFLTTPNVHSLMQKIRFLFSDKLAYFHECDYQGSGHIHPIFDWLLERMTRDKFHLVKYTSQTFHLRFVPKLPAIRVPYRHRLFAVNNIYAFRKVGPSEATA